MNTRFEMKPVGALALNSVSKVYNVEGNAQHSWQVVSPGGFVATIDIQASLDGGTSWASCALSSSFGAITAPGMCLPFVPSIALALVRWQITAYTSGSFQVFYQGLPA